MDGIKKKEFKYTVSVDEFDPESFSPTTIREARRQDIIQNCVLLCSRIIKDFGIEDRREHDFLLAKIGITITGQGFMVLQNALIECDHEADLVREAQLGKVEDYAAGGSRVDYTKAAEVSAKLMNQELHGNKDLDHVDACKDHTLEDIHNEHTTDRS